MSVILMTQNEHFKHCTEVHRYTNDQFVSFYLYETDQPRGLVVRVSDY